MNTKPNPNYPLPEKWYVKITFENAEKVNALCNKILSMKASWGTNASDHNEKHFTPYIHSIYKRNKTKCYVEPLEGYTEVTYEDLWLAYMIPEKWYCVDVECKDFRRWRKLNNNPLDNGFAKYLVLSKHLTDNSYYWGGYIEHLKKNNSYKDYKEISKETYLKLLNILEQKKNSNKTQNKIETMPTEVIIPLTEFKKIIDVACTDWQGRLKAYILKNLQNDCVSVKVTKDFYEQMIKASTYNHGVNQADIINSVLPMFKHDPYKVFKDALNEGKIVQIKIKKTWIDIFNKNYVFVCPIENYRIKHKHQDLIDEWEASGRTKEVECQGISTGRWILTKDPAWNKDFEYRFKPEPKYEPFTFEDAEFLIGKAIKSIDGTVYNIISYISKSNIICASNIHRSYTEILENFTFLDGTPCGKLVSE